MAQAKKPSKVKKEDKKQKEIKEAELITEVVPVDNSSDVSKVKPETAKAGKRSTKAQKELAEKEAKQARKNQPETKSEEAKKPSIKPPRSKIERAGKKYKNVAKLIDKSKPYTLAEALELAVKTSTTKFDSTVELHINLGVDPRQADQNVRGNVTLPHGTGKTLRVAVFSEPDDDKKALAAGADLMGIDKISAALEKEQTEFDVLIATPSTMAKLAKYAKLLGPKGLMPNPKSGTVTADVAKAVKEAKAGKVEFRVDSTGIVHIAVGKVSFGAQNLAQNAQVLIDAIKAAKPASLKNIYIKSAFITTTMGPSLKTQIT